MDNHDDGLPFRPVLSRSKISELTYTVTERGALRCDRCRLTFPDQHHFYSHTSSDSIITLGEVNLKPFRGLPGKWVKRKDFTENTGVGYFQCCKCTKDYGAPGWSSKYASRDYGQGCKHCNNKQWLNAIYFWVNHPSNRRRRGRGARDYGDHLEDLCEACEIGVCRFQQERDG